MNIDFPLILVLLTMVTGLIWLIDYCFFSYKRLAVQGKEPWWVNTARSFFPVFLIVLIIRSFIFQLYRVPSGSLEPTIVPGDFVLVAQYAYGLRLPVLKTKILNISKPKRGDIAVFYYPPNPSLIYIKRIVGIPGDKIVYSHHTLYINGKKATQKIIGNQTYNGSDRQFLAQLRQENLGGIKHRILIDPTHSEDTISYHFTVPAGYYFAMGDNRDDSADSRMWGFVPEKNLIGKAYWLVFSWDSKNYRIRWSRIGKRLFQ